MRSEKTCFFKLFVACFVLMMLASVDTKQAVFAGQYNRVLDIGDAAPQWQNLVGVDDKKYSLGDFQDKAVVVLVFTCNSCPYAVDVQQRLVELQNWLADRNGQLVAINSNKVAEDLLPEMVKRADEAGFTFPYLFDETQEVARGYGATTTPEFFVIDRDRKVRYMGSLDDSPDGKKIQHQYVRDAVEEVLGGNAIVDAETVPIGCRIRFERVKRSR